jgi:hypothetical protein
MGSSATTVARLLSPVYQIIRSNTSVYRIRTLYMKGMSYAMETTKAAEANGKGLYPTAEAGGLYALDQ